MEQIERKGVAVVMPFVRKQYEVEDILNLPKGQRAELLDGEMVMMASPTRTHQAILMWLSSAIFQTIQDKGGKCSVFPAPFAVFIKNDKRNYVEPDIVVVCDKDKLDEAGCHGAPDWIIEIVSPASEKLDYERKLGLYRESGVREYWIVDAANRMVTVHRLELGEQPVRYDFAERIKPSIYDSFEIDFSEMENYLE